MYVECKKVAIRDSYGMLSVNEVWDCTHEIVSEVSVHVVSDLSYAGEGFKVAGIIMVD